MKIALAGDVMHRCSSRLKCAAFGTHVRFQKGVGRIAVG